MLFYSRTGRKAVKGGVALSLMNVHSVTTWKPYDKCRSQMQCDYCNGRYHTVQHCQEQMANKQDLIEAVRQDSQNILAFLSVFNLSLLIIITWRHPPAAHYQNPHNHFANRESVFHHQIGLEN